MIPEHCPTCGGPVEIVTADEGTSSYRPMDDGAVERARIDAAYWKQIAEAALGNGT